MHSNTLCRWKKNLLTRQKSDKSIKPCSPDIFLSEATSSALHLWKSSAAKNFVQKMSVHLLLLLTAVLLLMRVPPCPSETYTFNQNIGVAFEFKVHVDAGKEECFGQYVQPGATFYVAFQVRRYCSFFPSPRGFSHCQVKRPFRKGRRGGRC